MTKRILQVSMPTDEGY